MEKAKEFQKNIYFCFVEYVKGFDCMDHNKLWKFLKEMGVPNHLTYLLRNLYAGKEAILRIGIKLGNECNNAILSSYLFNLHAEYIMQNARLDDSQDEIRFAGRNINTSDIHMIPP